MDNKAFTLVEILVVLGIVALGWFWLPQMLTPSANRGPMRFEDILMEMSARTRMEAIARQTSVALAVDAPGKILAVGYAQNGDFSKISQVSVDGDVKFIVDKSSVAGQAGNFDLMSGEDGFWRVWWFGESGQAKKSGGILTFECSGSEAKWLITDEGALLRQK